MKKKVYVHPRCVSVKLPDHLCQTVNTSEGSVPGGMGEGEDTEIDIPDDGTTTFSKAWCLWEDEVE